MEARKNGHILPLHWFMIFSIVAPAGVVAIRPAKRLQAQKSAKARRISSPQNINAASPSSHAIAVRLTSANSPSVVDNARQVQSPIQEHTSEELLPNTIPVELILNHKATRLDTSSSPNRRVGARAVIVTL